MSLAPADPGGRRAPGLVSLVTLRPDRVAVTRSGERLGYIDIVGGLFVVLRGTRYDRAEEILQTLSIHDAVAALTD